MTFIKKHIILMVISFLLLLSFAGNVYLSDQFYRHTQTIEKYDSSIKEFTEKTKVLKRKNDILKKQLDHDESVIEWYEQDREDIINNANSLLDDNYDNGYSDGYYDRDGEDQ